jgi:hypothetical protein
MPSFGSVVTLSSASGGEAGSDASVGCWVTAGAVVSMGAVVARGAVIGATCVATGVVQADKIITPKTNPLMRYVGFEKMAVTVAILITFLLDARYRYWI